MSTTPAPRTRPVADPDTSPARRIVASALAPAGVVGDLTEFHQRLVDAQNRIYTITERVSLDSLDRWNYEPSRGVLAHESGKFFSVEGIRVRVFEDSVRQWDQPIIRQPEVGILGILVKEFHGVLHFLMQLKAEPGNRNGIQISPTVQATRSNYMGVHGGGRVPYLEYFQDRDRHRVLADVRQSEQGAWFLGKRNRNMVVEVTEEVELLDGFHWLTLNQIHRLLALDDLVNMDARTVLSCLPFTGGGVADEGLGAALDRSSVTERGAHSMVALLSWITDTRTRPEVDVRTIALDELSQWRRTPERIGHREGRYFDVIGVRVEAGGREVGRWSQPMIAARGPGVLALLVTRVEGTVHVLMQTRVEPGLTDVVELAPTVQCTPSNYAHLPAASRPAFLDAVLRADPGQVKFDTMLSDEGGRFYHTSNRHLIVETETGPHPEPPGFRWFTLGQLTELLRHSHYLNVQARSLVVCLRSLVSAQSDRHR
ncbi:NDP-hexose 2,3-dehydratase family protein [Halostreptopolyspora alba]|uniref:NDP-hexose 2,3-dehydratase n=1 Tax=Halostreptopolyspora alba TaxID=2487137 RepID=A0A3N0EFP9_9ACTN|nr:NDP-hexose 2,3-dehydratase [Nocardiopsaceae bacterium YIM 96095]